MMNVNLILGIIAAIGVGTIVIGTVFDDILLWYTIDIYHGILFAIISFRLISLRNTKKQ